MAVSRTMGMLDSANKTEDERLSEGGPEKGPLVWRTLPWVGAVAAFAVACSWAGNLAGGRDTLAQFAPSDTAFYVHAESRAATQRLLAPDQTIPADVHPTEAAYVLTSAEPTKPRLLVAWSGFALPSNADRSALEAAGAKAVNARTYLFGGDFSAVGGGSLVTDEDVAVALRDARGAARTTAFAKFDALSPLVAAEPTPAAGLAALGRVVMRARLDPDGSFVMHAKPVMPVDGKKRRMWPWKPIQHPKLSVAEPVLALSGARLIVHSPDRDFSAFDLLFGPQNLVHVPADPNANAGASPEAANLRAVLDTATTLSLAERDGVQELFVHLPTVGPEALKLRLSQYLSVAWPKRRTLTLPDKSVTSELSRNDDLYQYYALANAADAASVSLSETSKILVASDNANGSVIGTNPDQYADMDNLSTDFPESFKADCPVVGTKWISMAVNPQDIPMPLWPYFRVTHVHIHSDVDTMVEFCGYTGDSGDKYGDQIVSDEQ